MKSTMMMVAGLLLAGSAANGQSYLPQTGDLLTTVPFEFHANGKIMREGQYTVRKNDNGSLRLCEDVYCVTVEAIAEGKTSRRPSIEFGYEGGRPVLARVLFADGTVAAVKREALKYYSEYLVVRGREVRIETSKKFGMSWY